MSVPSPHVAVTSLPNRPRVLIADDSRVIRMAIRKILGADYDLVEAGDGASAWERVREDAEIQALVTDIEMPNVDGYDLICRIRGSEENRLRDLPVIAITGAEDEQTKQRAFVCGATDFIVKPIDAIQLRARVQAYVRYDQTARELTEKSAILEDQAILDTMTGLCSRRFLIQRGEQDMAFAKRRGNDLSLIRVDIDHFRKLYKTHGDDTSEALLASFAKMVLGCVRTEDTVARVGGSQFAILANASDIEVASALCQRLQETVARQPYRHAGVPIPITLSMGIASLAQDRRENIEEMLKLTQQRLIHAQSEGGDRLCSSILSGMQEIEEVLIPPVEPPADSLSLLPEPAAEPVFVDPLMVAELEEIASPGADWTLDLPGVTDPVVEVIADLPLPAPEPEPATADLLAVTELTGLEWTDSQAIEPVPEVSCETDDAPELAVPEIPDTCVTTATEPVPMPSSDPLSIDKALHLLAQGRADLLTPFLDALMQKIKPLLDLSAQVRRTSSGQQADDKP